MSNLYETVKKILEQDSRFLSSDGTLLRNAVSEAAMKMDSDLIKVLYGNEETREHFFTDVEGIAVFDKVGFGWVINNKDFLPGSYTRYKNKIGLVNGREEFISSSKDVELVFPYKDCVLEGGQSREDQRHDEIFYNRCLAPDDVDRLLARKVFSGSYRYTKSGKSENVSFDKGDNLIIRGNNLLVLASLIARFEGEIQFIYIDPPYNTSNDSFKYNDTFKRSTWLTFMKNRLTYAWRLLKDTGIIAISINYKEMSYLKVLCDEIFKEENYITTVTVKTATTASFRAINDCPVNVSEFILIYAKKKKMAKINPVYVASDYSEDYGSYIENIEDDYKNWKIASVDSAIYAAEGVDTWQQYRDKYGAKWKEDRYEKKARFCLENADRVVSLNTMQKPSQDIIKVINESKANKGRVFSVGKNYFYNGRSLAFFSKKLREIDGEMVPTEILTNIWTDISFLSLGNEGGVDLPNGKKPEKMIKRLFDLYTDKDDIILDYHLGTGTTCAVAHKMGLQYIGIEQLDYGDDDCTVRLTNVINGEQGGISREVAWQGGGDFVYCELAELNQKYIDQIQDAKDEKTLLSIWESIKKTGFISCYVNPADIDESASDFKELSLEDKKHLFLELLDLNQLYVNYCDMDDETFEISDADKAFTRNFYGEN